ncbi:MAG TPA: phage tail protein [Caulobacteraceae bacterium]|nr:phage tail protein [Caulobacteraceae bacterium]
MSAVSSKNQPPAPIRYSGLNVGTSQFDLPVPIFWGTRRLTTNAIWFNDFTKTPAGGKGKGGGAKAQQAYDYKAAVILGLCEGPVDGIQNIWANGSTTTTSTLSALNLIFAAGASTEAPWSYVTTHYPAQAIAYRLTALLACPTLDLGESATIPDNDFECNRISTASFAVGASPTSTFIPWTAPADAGRYVGASFKLLTGAAAGQVGVVSAVSPSGVTLAAPLTTVPMAGDAFALGFAYIHAQAAGGWIDPNSHAQSPCNDCLMSDIVTDLLTNAQYGLGWTSADVGAIAQYAAYQRAQGLFFSPLLNQSEKATSLIDRWAQLSNGWIYWSGAQLLFVPLADAPITGNGASFTPDNDVAYDLGLADFIADKASDSGPVKVTRIDPADACNRTVLNITDRTLGYISNPFEFKDQTLVDAYGLRDNSNIQADDICDPAVARIVVQFLGKRAAYIRNSYAFKTSYRFIRCLPGTVLTLTEPNIGLAAVRVRVKTVAEDEHDQLSFVCEEFPGTAATYTPPLMAAQVNPATTPNQFVDPGPINTPAIVEPGATYTGGAPKLIIAASGGANWGGCGVNLSFDGVNYSQIGEITSAARQGLLTAALPAYAAANPDTVDTLAVDCTESLGAPSTAVTHADAAALRSLALVAAQPTLTGGAWVMPTDGELLAFGAVTPTATYAADLTWLYRGAYGASGAAHAIGDQFTLIDITGSDGTSLAYTLPPQYVGQTLYLKLASFNLFGLSRQDLSTCLEYQYTPAGTGFGGETGSVVALATSAIAAGAFVNVFVAAGVTQVQPAQANSAATFANGFALFPIASGVSGVVTLSGLNSAVAVAATQAQVWLSDATPGGFATSAPSGPGDIVQVLGPATQGVGVSFLPGGAPMNPRLVAAENGLEILAEGGALITTET